MQDVLKQAKNAILLVVMLSVLTGILYPAIITVLAQSLFSYQANGSLIYKNGKVIGSALIGQSFTSDKYFWGRPSATTPFPNNAMNSGGSNLSLTNPTYLATVKARVDHLRAANPEQHDLIPVDLVTASGSGLDPDISPAAIFYQINRVAKARHLPVSEIEMLVDKLIKQRPFNLLGEPRINVLQLNIQLDALDNNGDQQWKKGRIQKHS